MDEEYTINDDENGIYLKKLAKSKKNLKKETKKNWYDDRPPFNLDTKIEGYDADEDVRRHSIFEKNNSTYEPSKPALKKISQKSVKNENNEKAKVIF